MKRMKWLTVLGAPLAALIVAAVVWTARPRRSDGGSPAAAVRDDDSLRAELESSRQEIRQLQRTVAALAGRATPAPAAPAPDAPRPDPGFRPADLQSRISAGKERTERRYDYLQKVFDREAPDPQATGKVRDRLVSGLAAPTYAGFSLGALECRATMCSAVISAPAGANDHVLGQLVAMPEVSGGTLRRITAADGSTSVVAFLARAGHRLPRPADN
jgi:hypothetical protein